MTSFTDLVDDVILLIPQHLTVERDLNSLSRASKRLHALLDPVLYTQHVRSHGSWALSWATENDRASLVRRLLAAGAGLMIRAMEDGDLPLHSLAAMDGAVGVTKLLMETEGVDLNWTDREREIPPALLFAAGSGHAEIVALYLADSRVDPHAVDDDGMTALLEAAEHAHPGALEVILRDGRMDPQAADRSGSPPLFYAAWCGLPNAECIRMLLADPRVDPFATDSRGLTALDVAVRDGHAANVQPFLDAGLDPNHRGPRGTTALGHGAENNALGTVEALLRAPGVDPNARDDAGRTPLMRAAMTDSPQPAACLARDPRVLPNLPSNDWTTALMYSCAAGTHRVTQILVRRPDLDLGLKDPEGRTALDIAIQARSFGCVNVLRKKVKPGMMVTGGGRFAVDSVDAEGRNAMSHAAADAPDGVVKYFLKIERNMEGVDWMRQDNEGRDPVWYAKDNNRHHIADLLEEGRDRGERRRPSMSPSERSGSGSTCIVI